MSMEPLVAALAGACGLAPAAQAAPPSPAPADTLAGHVAGATARPAAFGCGPGWAPNRWGRCRPIYRGSGDGPRPFDGPGRFYGLSTRGSRRTRAGFRPRPFTRVPSRMTHDGGIA